MKKKPTSDQIRAYQATLANRPNAHVTLSPEVLAYRKNLLASIPAWREDVIRLAHTQFLKEKESRQPRKVRHPVLMGDR